MQYYIYSTTSQNQVKLDAQHGNPDHNTQTEVLTVHKKKERITAILLMTRSHGVLSWEKKDKETIFMVITTIAHQSFDFQY